MLRVLVLAFLVLAAPFSALAVSPLEATGLVPADNLKADVAKADDLAAALVEVTGHTLTAAQAKPIIDMTYQSGSAWVNPHNRDLNEDAVLMLMCHAAQIKAARKLIGNILLIPKIAMIATALVKGVVNPVALAYAIAMHMSTSSVPGRGGFAGALARMATGGHRMAMRDCLGGGSCSKPEICPLVQCYNWRHGGKTVMKVDGGVKQTDRAQCNEGTCVSDGSANACEGGLHPACAVDEWWNSCVCVAEVDTSICKSKIKNL